MSDSTDFAVSLPTDTGTFTAASMLPVGLLDVAGYYGPLRQMLAHTVQQGFFSPAQHDTLLVDDSAARLLQRLRAACGDGGEDYSRI